MAIQNPICFGMVDAAPAAQGCIKVRWLEMIFDADTEPYRYCFHVKPVDLGVLTKAEIDAETWYARSLHAPDEGSPSKLPYESPSGTIEILEATIAFEAFNQNGDNDHLFTNREYQVAVRAIAIDATNTIYEDDNEEVVISYSSGYQGVQWSHIVSWPDLEIIAIPPVSVGITATPAVSFSDDASVSVNELPQIDAHVHKGGD